MNTNPKKKMTGETPEVRSNKRKPRERKRERKEKTKKKEKERKGEKRREKKRKRCPGSIIINLHSIRKKKN